MNWEWSSDLARVEHEDSVVFGRLPEGPVVVLDGSALQIVRLMGDSFSTADLVEGIALLHPDQAAEARAQTLEFITRLHALGLLRPRDQGP